MANELLPHYKGCMPAAAQGTTGYLDADGGVSHAYSSRFPSGDRGDQNIAPEGGVIVATGADEVIDSAGVFTPYGAKGFADLAALIAANPAANPGVAWTAASHVVLGDKSTAQWNGSAWVDVVLPDAVEESEVPTEPGCDPVNP